MRFPTADDFALLLARLTEGLRTGGFEFVVIGGQAVALHGEPRFTRDIDLTLAAGPDRIHDLLELCSTLRLTPSAEDPVAHARYFFTIPSVDDTTGLKVDFILSTLPYEAEAVRRAVNVEMEGVQVPFASAEDLVLFKLFAGRPRDQEDAVSVVRRKGRQLDWPYLERWAQKFSVVEGREDLPDRLESLKAELT